MDKMLAVFAAVVVIGLAFAAFVALQPSLTGVQQNMQQDAAQDTNSYAASPSAAAPVNNEVGQVALQTIVLETTKGNIEIQLDAQKAPVTVKNILQYAESGFYDGTVFHRVIPGFMIQGGGFTINASEKPTKPPIKLEAGNGLKNAVGAVAMARTNDPNSATAQFFINLADNAFLDASPGNPGYAVFGKVTKGMEVVNTIAKIQTASKGQFDDWPTQNIVITKAYVKK